MQKPNEHGVCEAETVEELARRGRAYASIELCQCEDGLYRYALAMAYNYGGFCGPISITATGYASPSAAKEAATEDLLRRFPKPWASEPQSVHDELRELKAMIEGKFRQPCLF
jgi:hypothetical protein